uniref:LacI family DNA-binding transcriptional regulator n=1 Tax=Sinorhizobium sojae TaxID=716925 RepID=UPI00055807CB
MRERPKIKDIAVKAGVSVATVSRALADSSLVTAETRQRIRELARELNYRPNVSARNLRTRKSMAVLLVVRDVGNPFYLDVLKGVEATAREAGYSVLMGNTENDPARETEYFNMLRDGHADGMILMTGKLPPGSGRRA